MNHLSDHHKRMQDNGRRPKYTRKAKKLPATVQRMKLQLDHRTIITITKASSLDFWRKRYPNLTILP